MPTFHEFNLNHQVVRALEDMGFAEATPIQNATIPTTLAGKDVIGQAQTGTGKTGAFGVPLIEKINVENDHVQGLILAPTRELANQVSESLVKFGKYKGVRTVVVYGGQDMRKQIRDLKRKPHVVVATPGRLMDHMNRKTIRLNQVETVILDEADEMLNMGFIEDIETILKEIPNERQTLLFSATMPKRIEKLAQQFMKEPQTIAVKAKEVTMENIEQFYIELHEKQKFDALCRLVDIHTPELAIVFGRTKRRVDELSEALIKRGYRAEGIHGDLNQAKRDSVLRKFKNGLIEILVATDVAARGLDISGVTHVYNFDLPQDPESYVHRIGRTGRAGKSGMAVTFATPSEKEHVAAIEKTSKKKMTKQPMPTFEEAMEGQQKLVLAQLREKLDQEDTNFYRAIAKDLLQETDATTALAAALKLLTKEPDTTDVKLTGEAPLRSKKRRSDGGGRPYRRSGGGGGRGDNRRSYNRKDGDRDRNRRSGSRSGGGQRSGSGQRTGSSQQRRSKQA
ncbi:DEAD/DEAH box helicase [Alkalihalobacillus alcalophilus ATCC 27647 = CGMCC 1.3604]|uniref:DEAD-box ATP-dependent RNA helicase CshA n=1 Tax=Alkalihalobacillus alcalophilus ATCC 27647 = CGMCC 1.3604 TaxID=1218173 RepID=A0A094WEH8_ALKAL|nr:DEAD/DEAH box helicase [Alkalihalobacillus alcalophilus]KGA96164.1 DEAD/DEAH box helicase [Alkalihalobacillus alcalophilus ATCC 27647 = CGMCC 1.3604]MED1562034.1 DEAD/DEAH box helicase [Alkalihalobacillus alcalophilus]THG89381.1 DEAD/DEAH box helicase [Alkalihalobacillus alcalophilus ATCC 27647 = CGMCC 1.3604]